MTALRSHPGARRALKRVPGLIPALNARRRVGWELGAVAHGLRAGRIATRLSGQEVLHQSIPGGASVAPLPARTHVVATGPWSDDEIRARVLVANALNRRGLGPRLYDARRTAGGTAFVFDDEGTEGTSPLEGERVLIAIGQLLSDGVLLPAAQRQMLDAVLGPEARSELHFGREYRLRGNRYLYQSVPGVGASGRRNSHVRWERIRGLLDQAGVGLDDRLVLDVGCNAGMMLAAALADGAAWGVGWDLPAVALRARDVLSALGFTRFDIHGADLVPDYPLTADVPAHVAPLLDGCVVLYLAISHHVGFLDELATIPWSALVFEGGEEQSLATLERDLAPLRERCAFRIAGGTDYRDGEGQMRPLALLVREPA